MDFVDQGQANLQICANMSTFRDCEDYTIVWQFRCIMLPDDTVGTGPPTSLWRKQLRMRCKSSGLSPKATATQSGSQEQAMNVLEDTKGPLGFRLHPHAHSEWTPDFCTAHEVKRLRLTIVFVKLAVSTGG